MTSAISTERISKHFGATRALDQIDFDVAFGEIHALVGENGAGKSTLIRILSGVHQPDTGRILVNGHAVEAKCLLEAALCTARGISISQMLRQRGWGRASFYRRVDAGASEIADALNRCGVPVR